jgi:hypothetical protein
MLAFLQTVSQQQADSLLGLALSGELLDVVIGNFAPTKNGKVESTKNGKIQPSIHLHDRT